MALVKLFLILAAIIVSLNRKWNLALVLLAASIAVSLLFGQSFVQTGRTLVLSAVDVLTLRMVLAVVLIIVLGELLRQTAGLQRMVQALEALIPSQRLVVALLPAVVGLLPMIGGAMFSAPLVDEVGNRLGASGERKTFVNYWFRHIWELILPVHPSMVLAAALLGLSIPELAGAAWPLMATAVAGGLAFGLLRLPSRGEAAVVRGSRLQSVRTLTESIWPVVLVVVLPLALHVDERVDLILSLVVTLGLTIVLKRIPPGQLMTVLRGHVPWRIVAVIFGALAFRSALDDSGAVAALSSDLSGSGVPMAALAFAVPFVAGLLTGLMPAAFSIGFSVALPLVVGDGGTISRAWATWLVAGGFLGTMISPVHLCLALTRAYFGASWGGLYWLILPSALLIALVAAGILWMA